MTSRRIKVDYLARVEGEGGLDIRIRNGRVRDVKLNIFEPPRLFEGFLRGRHYAEASDITARICGICPVAHQMSACHAMEDALGIHVQGSLRDLRRLLYCGEWIESHALHVFLLHAPDFLGYQDAAKKDDRQVYFAYPFEYQGEWWPWEKFAEWARGTNNAFGRAGKKVRSPSAKSLAVDVMKGIVRAATDDGRRERKEVPPDVKFGLAGIEAFAADVADTSKKPDDFDGGWLGCHAICPQISGRKSAAVYLSRVAGEFPKTGRDHLLAAAKAYEAAFAAWREWGKHLGPNESRKTLAQLKKAWRVKKNREAGAAAIRKALEREKAAIEEIKKALASLAS